MGRTFLFEYAIALFPARPQTARHFNWQERTIAAGRNDRLGFTAQSMRHRWKVYSDNWTKVGAWWERTWDTAGSSVCPSVCLSVSVFQSICLSSLPVFLCIRLLIRLSVSSFLSAYPFVSLSMSIRLSVYLSILDLSLFGGFPLLLWLVC